jgi:hypothetical protein
MDTVKLLQLPILWESWLGGHYAPEADDAIRACTQGLRDAMGQAGPEAVGKAAAMPGTNGGFTHCAFKATDVPEGTDLFTAPPPSRSITSLPAGWELEPSGDTIWVTNHGKQETMAVLKQREPVLFELLQALLSGEAAHSLPSG